MRRIKLDNTVVFHKLAALDSAVVPHDQTNATTEALVDTSYSCKLIVATFLVVTLHFYASCRQKQLIIGNEE
jgi:hypothetical protein